MLLLARSDVKLTYAEVASPWGAWPFSTFLALVAAGDASRFWHGSAVHQSAKPPAS